MSNFTQEELKGLELIAFEEPFKCDTIVRFIDGVRQVFHAKKQGSSHGLHDYACDVDQYFGTTLFDPCCGLNHVGVKETETLKLNLQELLFLREDVMSFRDLVGAVSKQIPFYVQIISNIKINIKNMFRSFFPISNQVALEKLAQKMEGEGTRYQELKKGKYSEFFEEAKSYNWANYHTMFYSHENSPFKNLPKTPSQDRMPVVDRLLAVVASDTVTAMVKEILHSTTVNNYSGAPPSQQVSAVP